MKMKEHLVSIIMPLYNAEKHVEQAIQSIIDQTYGEWELLAIDDCSTDNTPSILQHLAEADHRIRIFRTEKQSGSPAIPRNLGVQHAEGRYIAFLDSDDYWLPTKLEEQLPLFSDSDTKIVFSYYSKLYPYPRKKCSIVRSPERVDYHQLLLGNVIGNLTGIYDTAKVGKQFFLPLGHEDYIHWLHILKPGGYAVNTGLVHAVYRVSASSVSANKLRAFVWDWHIYRYVEHLSIPYSCYCFAHYAVKGIIKYFI